jgi:hypothetical protein
MCCNTSRTGFSLVRNYHNAGVLQIYLMTFGSKFWTKLMYTYPFLAVIVIGYNILLGGLDMDRI